MPDVTASKQTLRGSQLVVFSILLMNSTGFRIIVT